MYCSLNISNVSNAGWDRKRPVETKIKNNRFHQIQSMKLKGFSFLELREDLFSNYLAAVPKQAHDLG